MQPFNLFWIGVVLGAVLLVTPQLLLRSMSGYPLFGSGDDSTVMRMGRICGFFLMIIFGALVFATTSRGN